ncbi:MAG: HD domain-containing protein [Deltaproteobacteria bacterium]|nr:HD domain-containing protein [Deltaproteobacteria bacterium]
MPWEKRFPTVLTAGCDDDTAATLKTLLGARGASVLSEQTAPAALQAFRRRPSDAVLLDLSSPDEDALVVLHTFVREFPATPVILLAHPSAMTQAATGIDLGGWDVVQLPIATPLLLHTALRNAMEKAETLRENRCAEAQFASLKEDAETPRNFGPVELERLANAIATIGKLRDPYTAEHQCRVAQLAEAIGRQVGLTDQELWGLRIASELHDVGKLSIPIEILCKPGKLNSLELDVVRAHPKVGSDLLASLGMPDHITQPVLQHQELLDGSGYPEGLSGSDICRNARLLTVADVVESMGSHRPYRPSKGFDRALGEITRNRGILYDVDAVDACLAVFSVPGHLGPSVARNSSGGCA